MRRKATPRTAIEVFIANAPSRHELDRLDRSRSYESVYDMDAYNKSPYELLTNSLRLRERAVLYCFNRKFIVTLDYCTRLEKAAVPRGLIEQKVFETRATLRTFIEGLPNHSGEFELLDELGFDAALIKIKPNPKYSEKARAGSQEIPENKEKDLPQPEQAMETGEPEPKELEAQTSVSEQGAEEGGGYIIPLESILEKMQSDKAIEWITELISEYGDIYIEYGTGQLASIAVFQIGELKSERAMGLGGLKGGSVWGTLKKSKEPVVIFKHIKKGPALIFHKVESTSELLEVKQVSQISEFGYERGAIIISSPAENGANGLDQGEITNEETEGKKPEAICLEDFPIDFDQIVDLIAHSDGKAYVEYRVGQLACVEHFDTGQDYAGQKTGIGALESGKVWNTLHSKDSVVVSRAVSKKDKARKKSRINALIFRKVEFKEAEGVPETDQIEAMPLMTQLPKGTEPLQDHEDEPEKPTILSSPLLEPSRIEPRVFNNDGAHKSF